MWVRNQSPCTLGAGEKQAAAGEKQLWTEASTERGAQHHALGSFRCPVVRYGRGDSGKLQFMTVLGFSEPQGKERADDIKAGGEVWT